MADSPEPPMTGADAAAYQVLARKYRPGHFRDLIGQEAMVRTLTNAFEHDRIAHAFMMTGVRGVGKTTTARIIAKGLNCTGRGDRPTIDPCGECGPCRAIAEGRHVDVIEMDAASHTKVEEMRDLLASVPYRPTEVRYKVYIIDEVHMLSTSSFNALLKTLEEPPAHVKFIFATTEIRKVPVTVLSRCQRFDLRRIEPEVMMDHLAAVAEKEGAKVSRDALALVTRAAEGSVRDALSLLDQAIAHGQGGETDAAAVRSMLGLADRARVFDLFEAIMRGDCSGALDELSRQYADGADPAVVLRDLAELTHWVSVVKVSEAASEDPTVSGEERTRGRDLAERLSMRVLTRAWQMLLKAIEELAIAPSAMMAAEMAVIRLTHVADLPSPDELIRRLTAEGGTQPRPGGSAGGGGNGTTASAAPRPAGEGGEGPRLQAVAGGAAPQMAPARPAEARAPLETIDDVAALIGGSRDIKLLDELERFVRVVSIRPGLIEFNPAAGAPADLAGRLSERLRFLTGERWSVAVSDEPGGETIAERRAAEEQDLRAEAERHPLVIAALATFPGAKIAALRPLGPANDPQPDEFLAAVPEDDTVEIDGDILDSDDPFGEEI